MIYAAQPVSSQTHGAAGGGGQGDAPAHTRSEFIAFLGAVLVKRGSVVAVYEPVNPKAYGRATIGFDAATGAWFSAGWATEMAATGRDPEGRGFAAQARRGSARPYEFMAGAPPLPIGSHFPFATLFFLADHPDAVRSAERQEDGSWVVGWQPPQATAGPELPEAFLIISPDGTPLKSWQDRRDDRREVAFEYAANSPPGFPVVSRFGPPHAASALVHVEFFPEGNLAPFSQESVAETSYDNSVIVHMKEQAVAAGLSRGGEDRAGALGRPVVPFAGRHWDRLRWPLVLAGAIVIALAAIEIYRRRAG